MPVTVICPTCRGKVVVADQNCGKTLRCGLCKGLFTAPSSPKAVKSKPQSKQPARPAAKPSANVPKPPSRPASPKSANVEAGRPKPTVPAKSQKQGISLIGSGGSGSPPRTRPASVRRQPAPKKKSGVLLFLTLGGLAAVLMCLITGVGVAGILYLQYQAGPADNNQMAEVKKPAPPAPPLVVNQKPKVDPPNQPANHLPPGGIVPEQELPKKESPKKEPPKKEPPKKEPPKEEPPKTGSNELDRAVLKRVKDASLYMRVHLPGGKLAQGSGFFAMEPGLILTNAHVLGMLDEWNQKPTRVEAVYRSGLPGEKKFEAEILGVDRSSDLAVLRVKGNNLPKPLNVKLSKGLYETQTVFVLGFPFGEQVGRNITVSQTTISSLRDIDKDGMLDKLQTNGGMHPGNSGGPVINTSGEVIGVAVSGIRGTQINFAIPGDFVHVVLNGRVSRVKLHAKKTGGKIQVDAEVETIDPLGRVKELAVDFWTGSPGKGLKPSRTPPIVMPGQSRRHKLTLNPNQKTITGTIDLPELKSGEIYWYQPYILNGAGQKFWSAAAPFRPKFDPGTFVGGPEIPGLKKEEASLVLRPGTTPRFLKLTSKQTLRLASTAGDNLKIPVNMIATMLERPLRYDRNTGLAYVRLEYKKYTLSLPTKYITPKADARLRRVVPNAGRLAANLVINRSGDLVKNEVDVSKVPFSAREDLADLHSQIQESLEAVAVPVPNRKVKPNDTWKAIRKTSFGSTSDLVQAALRLTYRYLGVMERDGEKHAVIAIVGEVVSRKGTPLTISGKAKGIAYFDLAKGQLVEAQVSATTKLRLSIDGERLAADITMVSTLDRGKDVLTPKAPPLPPGAKYVLNKKGNLVAGRRQSYKVKLEANKFYTIDLQSQVFDPYLELYDGSGKLIQKNDDVRKGNLNSQIVFRAPQSGEYMVVARSYQPQRGGVYRLTVRQDP